VTETIQWPLWLTFSADQLEKALLLVVVVVQQIRLTSAGKKKTSANSR
jgi:hypothetical protein